MVGCGEFVNESLEAVNRLLNHSHKQSYIIYKNNVSPRVLERDRYLRSREYKTQSRLNREIIGAMGTIGGHKLPYQL